MRQGHGQEPEPKGVLYPPSGALPSLKIAQDLAKAHGWDDYDVTSAVSLVLRDKIDKNTAAAIAAVSP